MADDEEDEVVAEELGLLTDDALSATVSTHGLRSLRLFCIHRKSDSSIDERELSTYFEENDGDDDDNLGIQTRIPACFAIGRQ